MTFQFKGLSPAEKMRSRRLYDAKVQKVAASTTSTSLIESFLALVCETLYDEFGFGNANSQDSELFICNSGYLHHVEDEYEL